MLQAQLNAFLFGGVCWGTTTIALAVLVYKINIEPMYKRRDK